MHTQTLNGEWAIISLGEREVAVTGRVPGVVHEALLQHDIIPDPFYRDQEAAQRWVGEADWRYERSFMVDEALLRHERVLLRCHGLDTVAAIALNGREIARTENMYRVYEWDVRDALHAGENQITVTFTSPMRYSREQEAALGTLPLWGLDSYLAGTYAYIRKEPANFGWDWGPQLVTSGIWRDIELLAFDTGRIRDVQILQEHGAEGVDVTLRVEAEHLSNAPLHARLRLSDGAGFDETVTVPVTAEATFRITNPRLWWVRGMGEQPLYDLEVVLLATDETPLDRTHKRIGLRTLRLDRHADEWGESFQFTCNSVPFFAKGANWIPGDVFPSRMTRADYERLIHAALDANMNMLRVWGGGIYESDDFYDLCDELGIAVWQDFAFACSTAPTFDDAFMQNVRAEAEDNVRRLRHHASLALWCGNNEIEQGLVAAEWSPETMSWADYSKLFDVLLRDVVQRLDPQTDYVPGSPHKPCADREDYFNEDCGDAHLWAVWHGKQPFEWYRGNQHRFISEFGFQSFPEPRTTREFTRPEDRNITSYTMEYHQRSPIGNGTVIHYMLEWFKLPTSFEMMSWLSQFLQAIGMKYAVEHWRRNMPRTMGTLYWQLNDLWPGPTWSSLDWRGRWKALHYLAKRFYAPVLISGVEDRASGTVEVHITSDEGAPIQATMRWQATDAAGNALDGGALPVTVAPRTSGRVTTLDVQGLLQTRTDRDVLVWLELIAGEELLSSNLITFNRPKHLALQTPQIRAELQIQDGQQAIVFSSDVVALGVWVEVVGERDFRLSDNFFSLRPNQPYTVQVIADEPIMSDDFAVHSLTDTYA